MADDIVWFERMTYWNPQAEDAREGDDIDYARIVHSGSFRRLQGKTQILNLGDSDFYRTRLTHSLEVAQIGGSIVRQLARHERHHPGHGHLPSRSMIHAIGMTHDLGHPPFGHGGEVALNYCMRDHGGFEGNGQTLRILTKLEKFSADNGANLTRRTLLGGLKYPIPFSRAANPELLPRLDPSPTAISLIDRKASKPPKAYLDCDQEAVDWILSPLSPGDRNRFIEMKMQAGKHGKSLHKSFDCTIMDLADDIAFGVHDLEDALALRLINEAEFRRFVPENRCSDFLDKLAEKSRKKGEPVNNQYERMVTALFGDGNSRKHFISQLVGHFVTHCRLATNEEFEEPLLRYRAIMDAGPSEFLAALQEAVRETVILSPSVQHLEFKGQKMVVSVFEALASEPRLFLPGDTRKRYEASDQPMRVICDHISGMTDHFLLKTYERLFSPRMGSVFDRL
ncbi:anti-phage deoxyguanosine triphosphatase [Sphingoaurantiacus capsulatus]|uniref:Anti-phage deoxyguanosine triphosphatase n=1 Tax=Sphingoaurantiacus capsulatus TaxID=1771310 RepID=A0ABV7XDS1_9SPHN